MKHWVRIVAGEPAVLLAYDELNVEARVGIVVDTFTKAEWEAFTVYSGPVERAIHVGQRVDIRDPATWPYRPFLSVVGKGFGRAATVIEPDYGQPRQVIHHPIDVVRKADATGSLDDLVGGAASYPSTADLLMDYDLAQN